MPPMSDGDGSGWSRWFMFGVLKVLGCPGERSIGRGGVPAGALPPPAAAVSSSLLSWSDTGSVRYENSAGSFSRSGPPPCATMLGDAHHRGRRPEVGGSSSLCRPRRSVDPATWLALTV
jgi:hypothetical protein